MSDFAVFNHEEPAMVVQGQDYKLLKQGENYFSYAEWDRYAKRYVPEPKFVRFSRKTPDQLKAVLEETLFLTSQLRQKIDKMHTDVTENIDLFHDAAKLANMTAVQLLRDDLDKTQNLLMEEAQQKNMLLEEMNKLKEAKKEIEAEVKVLKREMRSSKKA